VAIVWGLLLLATLTYLVARERKVNPQVEVVKHVVVAAGVTIVSIVIGRWIGAVLS
jgi:VIT1/CCC1 family predicted Fe2+/Mn2+ transporter